MAQADWIIDMGPEGGYEGGTVVAEGTPADVMKKKTHTAKALSAFKKAHAKLKK